MKKIAVLVVTLVLALSLSADEIYVPIAGSVGVFSTDMRLVNPSPDQTIVIQATYLPRNNVDNSARTPIEITIPPREMAVYDDVVASLFQAGDLGAIHLVSEESFKATARIFAQESAGTLGQFVVGVAAADALQKGILLQLESSGEFRTNLGFVNPDKTAPANVEMTLYDADNEIIATTTLTLQPWGVVAPTGVGALFQNPSGDLTDAWVSFAADKPVIGYASVIDNRTTDPTYVPAVIDTGSAPPQQPVRTINVSAFQWGYTFQENGILIDDLVIAPGTKVIMNFQSQDVRHGFEMPPYVSLVIEPGSTQTREWVAGDEGTVTFFCTVSTCGAGHTTMSGTLEIGD